MPSTNTRMTGIRSDLRHVREIFQRHHYVRVQAVAYDTNLNRVTHVKRFFNLTKAQKGIVMSMINASGNPKSMAASMDPGEDTLHCTMGRTPVGHLKSSGARHACGVTTWQNTSAAASTMRLSA